MIKNNYTSYLFNLTMINLILLILISILLIIWLILITTNVYYIIIIFLFLSFAITCSYFSDKLEYEKEIKIKNKFMLFFSNMGMIIASYMLTAVFIRILSLIIKTLMLCDINIINLFAAIVFVSCMIIYNLIANFFVYKYGN